MLSRHPSFDEIFTVVVRPRNAARNDFILNDIVREEYKYNIEYLFMRRKLMKDRMEQIKSIDYII